jgi:uroporphyrinogen III methyltransferase/synthase
MERGKVYLVGAGPGNPGLITIRGSEILHLADVVIYDYLVDKRILSEARQAKELICCDRLGKSRYSNGFLISQKRINALMVKKAREGKIVVRLKNGDPSIFGRLSQELDSLVSNKIDFEIVPGVTAASAASCVSGIPLTDRRFASSCVFVSGHEDPMKKSSLLHWESLAKSGTIVLYMAVENLPLIVKRLFKAGKPAHTPCAIIKDATLSTQRILIGTLGDIAERARAKKIKPPVIVIVGEVVGLGEKFNWFKKLPLFGKGVLITRPREEAIELAKILEDNGAVTHILPTIEIRKDDCSKRLDSYLKKIDVYDWVIFLSQHGANSFFNSLRLSGMDIRALKGVKLCAIGPKTKETIESFGVNVKKMPKKFCKDSIMEEFKKINISGKKVLMVCSSFSDNNLISALRALGAKVDYVYGYITVLSKKYLRQIKSLLKKRCLDLITFTSPSCVHGFMGGFKKGELRNLLKGVKFAAIGPITRATLTSYGIKAIIQPKDYTIESLTKEIVSYYKKGSVNLK